MWPWLSALCLIAALADSPAFAINSEVGPASPAEAALLWKDGKEAHSRGKWQDAVNRLERLIARHPGAPGYLEAHRLLGEAYLGLDETAKALPVLKSYVEGTRSATDGARGRLLLGKALLSLERYDEAALLAREFEKKSLEKSMEKEPELRARGLILKARALTGLGRDEEAGRALDSLSRLKFEQPAVAAEASLARLDLKTRSCARLPGQGSGQGSMDELQARSQFDRRGTCLEEALLQFMELQRLQQALPKSDQPHFAADAERRLIVAYDSYARGCLNPPSPPAAGKPGPEGSLRRSKLQLERYRTELVTLLKEDCARHFASGVDLLGTQALSQTLSQALRKIARDKLNAELKS